MRVPAATGTRRTAPHGYVLVKQPGHHRASQHGWVYEHVLVVERATGKPLLAPAQIHHVDLTGSNNRPGNLVVCPDDAYHRILHMRSEAYDASGHADWRKCGYCHLHDDPAQMVHHALGKHTEQLCHLRCRRDYYRRQRHGVAA